MLKLQRKYIAISMIQQTFPLNVVQRYTLFCVLQVFCKRKVLKFQKTLQKDPLSVSNHPIFSHKTVPPN